MTEDTEINQGKESCRSAEINRMISKIKHGYIKVMSKELEGIGVIEMILILVIIIGLVLIFRNQIEAIISSAFASIHGNVEGIGETIQVN